MTENMELSKEICDYWKGEEFDDKLRFPGAQPVSIELKDIQTIKSNEYWCCPKLDGERFFLMVRGKDTYLVNRNMEFTKVNIEWNNYIETKGIILDGELITNQFIVHDAIEILGKSVKNKPFNERWNAANSVVGMQTGGDIKVILKSFFSVKQLDKMLEWSKGMPTDGVIFYPVKDPIGYKTQLNFFKWKPPGHHTIDFLVREINRQVHLITWSKGQETTFEKLPIKLFNKMEHFNPKECVVEFNTEILGGVVKFKPIKVRTDKPQGNNLYTVRKTILNTKENITIDKLIEQFCA